MAQEGRVGGRIKRKGAPQSAVQSPSPRPAVLTFPADAPRYSSVFFFCFIVIFQFKLLLTFLIQFGCGVLWRPWSFIGINVSSQPP